MTDADIGSDARTPNSPTPRSLRLGTRGSPLARWQSNWVADRLRSIHPGLEVELVEIKTHGDRDRNSPLAAIGGMGLFTKEIQRALLDGRVEVAVHSLKDLPTQDVEGLTLGAIPEREDVTDALISPRYRTLDELPNGASVGTGSLRRRAMLLHARPDLRIEPVRGNVETRLNQALSGELDAVVLASAGLERLGLAGHVTERLGPPGFLGAAGQGALGIECRIDDESVVELLRGLNDPGTRAAVIAERRALGDLEGGCMIPLGVVGTSGPNGRLTVRAAVLDANGRERVEAEVEGPVDEPVRLGKELAEVLLARGAGRLLGR